jgi:glycosyltransferase involved in cell wall biosynthesis
MSAARTVLIISNEAWGPVWFSKQHYAHQLSLLGHRVLFVQPPDPWRPAHLWGAVAHVTEARPGLRLLKIRNRLPFRYFRRLNDRLARRVIHRVMGKAEDVIWWQFDPLRLVARPSGPRERRIYHVVDPLHMVATDQEVARGSDLIVTVNEALLSGYKDIRVPKLVVPHGLDPQEHQIDPDQLGKYRNELGEGFLLFIGTLNVDVDLALLAAVADALPNERLLLVGPVHPARREELDDLLLRPNVRWTGPCPAEELKYPVTLSKVCLVPYRVVETRRWRTPLKVMNYLAQGRPVVSTVAMAVDQRLPFTLARTVPAFIEAVTSQAGQPPVVDPTAVEAFRRDHAYPLHIQRILERLDEVTAWGEG